MKEGMDMDSKRESERTQDKTNKDNSGKKISSRAKKMTAAARRHRNTTILSVCFALCVALAVVFRLILPAIALNDTSLLDCHYEVHQHDEACYSEAPIYDEKGNQIGPKQMLTCGKADYTIHQHDENCYQEGLLVCTLPEYTEHIHTEDCYQEQTVLVCDKQGGELDENGEPHVHDDSCYETQSILICGQQELHHHTKKCYDKDGNLICGLLELSAHQHTAECMKKVEEPDNLGNLESESVTEKEADETTPNVDDVNFEAESQQVISVEEISKEENGEEKSGDKLDTNSDDLDVDQYHLSRPAQSFESQAIMSSETINVRAEAPAGAFAEGTTMQVTEVNDDKTISVIKDTFKNDDQITGTVHRVQAVDIAFYDKEGHEVEPELPITVAISSSIVNDVSGDDKKELAAVHVNQSGQGDIITDFEERDYDSEDKAIVFEAESFSVYALISYTLDLNLEVDGKTYKITVTFDDESEIPLGTELSVTEIEPGTDEYIQHLGKAWKEINKEYLKQEDSRKNNINGLDEYEDIRPVNLDDARFFSVRLLFEGNKVEPKTPAHIQIEYAEGLDSDITEKDQVIGVAHYKEDTTEIISEIETVRDKEGKITEFIYDQDSFSDIGTFVGQKTYDNVPYEMSRALSMPLFRALSASGEGGNQLKDIEAHKSLTNNNDGTYTMSLSVTGDSVANEELNKANILFVMDRSSSMTKNCVEYFPYNGSYVNGTTYYGSNDGGKTFFTLSYQWDHYYNGYFQYNGQVYTGTTRLQAEQAAMDVLIKNLLAKNDPNNNDKKDLIEISVISFADKRQSGNTEYTEWTYNDYEGLMQAVNQTDTPSGTNWEDALLYAQKQAAIKKAQQQDEDVYIIFLTDGEPTAVAGESGGAWHYNNNEGGFEYALTESGGPYNSHGRTQDGLNSLDQAKNLVDKPNDFKLYGIFTFNPGEAQTKYLRRLINYAYTGVDKAYENDTTKEDTDIVKKYFTNADTPEALTQAFEKIFADVSSTLGYGDVVITDGLQAADAMTTTINADKADGFRYSVTDDRTGEELYYVTATGSDTTPNVTFHIKGQDYPAGASKTGVDGKPYYSVSMNGSEYKMALADLSGRELTWDLSSIGTLLPDCTYKVDIIVWPNQEAYDYVAGLNNHLDGYEWNSEVESNPDNYHEVTVNGETYGYYTGGVEGHDSIVKYKESDVYSVLTNTHQELNYSIVNTKTNEITGETTTISDPQDPIPLEPQKPMDLVDTRSKIEKMWNVSLDASILYSLLYGNTDDDGHIIPYEIEFSVLQGQSEYTKVKLPGCWDPDTQEYNWEDIDPDWNNANNPYKETYNGKTFSTRWLKDFAIATGLMLSKSRMDALGLDSSENSPYKTVTYTEKADDSEEEDKVTTYYILETGHDYTIKEPGMSFEFDFSTDVYHPMLVDGVLRSVTFSKDANNKDIITHMTSADADLSSLKVENTLRGYINLNKVIVAKDGKTKVESDSTKFEYHVELENEKPEFVGDHIPWYGIDNLYYHDNNMNYYQVEYNTDGQLQVTTENGGPYTNATCSEEGGFKPSRVTEQTIYYTDEEGTGHTIIIQGNRMEAYNGTDEGGYTNARTTVKITKDQTLNIANVPLGTKYTITEATQRGYELLRSELRAA